MRSPEPAVVTPRTDAARIAARLGQLWEIARGPGGGADRPAYSTAEAAAMRLIAGWAREAGLEPALDAHGNLWAAPAAGDGPLVSSGSHVDTVPDGGRYDGALGTVLALEAADALPGAVALLVCAAEEAPRFGAGTLGSRLAVGALGQESLRDLRDGSGTTASEARDAFVAELADLARIDELPLERVRAHVEVHVEQRSDLRRRGARLGVVERVAAARRHELVVHGRSGHAGEVPMADRRDALVGAAELVLALERAARAAPAPTVATAGELRLEPGAISAVPGRVKLGVELRGIDVAAIDAVEDALSAAVSELERGRGLRVERRTLRRGAPIAMDARLVEAARRAAERRGIPAIVTHSGAGHDAQHLAGVVPTALLFVPLAGGESHTPHEEADVDDIALAAEILIDLLQERSSREELLR